MEIDFMNLRYAQRAIDVIEYELRNASPETRKAVKTVKDELAKNERIRDLYGKADYFTPTDEAIADRLSQRLRCLKCPCYEDCHGNNVCNETLLRYIQTGKAY